MHTGSKSISFVPYLFWPRTMGVSTSPARIIAETSKETSLRTDRLSRFGHRMSLVLQTVVLRGILSGEQEHRPEHVRSKNLALRPAFGVKGSTSSMPGVTLPAKYLRKAVL